MGRSRSRVWQYSSSGRQVHADFGHTSDAPPTGTLMAEVTGRHTCVLHPGSLAFTRLANSGSGDVFGVTPKS